MVHTKDRTSRILRSLPPVHLAEEVTPEERLAAAEIDRRHLAELAAEKTATDLVLQVLQDHGGQLLAGATRIGRDCIGLELRDGSRVFITAEAT